MKAPHPILMIAVWLAVVAFAGVILYQNLELRSESKRLQHEVDSQSVLKLSEEIQLAKRFTPTASARAASPSTVAAPEIKPTVVRQAPPQRSEWQPSGPTAAQAFENVPDIEAAQRNFLVEDIPLYDPKPEARKPKATARSNPPSITVRPPPPPPPESYGPKSSVGKLNGFTDGGGVFGTSEKPATGNDVTIADCLVLDINKSGDGTLGINRGTDAGIRNDLEMIVVRGQKPVGMIRIINAGPYISVARIIEEIEPINVNDRCVLGK